MEVKALRRYFVPPERLYEVGEESPPPDGWVEVVPHADVVAVLAKAATAIRHLTQKNHLFSPLGCSGCDEAQRLLKELEE